VALKKTGLHWTDMDRAIEVLVAGYIAVLTILHTEETLVLSSD